MNVDLFVINKLEDKAKVCKDFNLLAEYGIIKNITQYIIKHGLIVCISSLDSTIDAIHKSLYARQNSWTSFFLMQIRSDILKFTHEYTH